MKLLQKQKVFSEAKTNNGLVVSLFANLNHLINNLMCIIVNRQGKWDTIGTKVNGHLGACSCFPGEVKYRLRKEQDHDSRNIR